MSFLTDEQKENIHGQIDRLHETFARDIVVFTQEQREFEQDGGSNPIYGPPSEPSQPVLVPHTVKARVRYMGEQERAFSIGTDSQINISYPRGTIRLKVDEEAYKLIQRSQKIRIDDRMCQLMSSPSRPGPFDPNFWTVFVKQID